MASSEGYEQETLLMWELYRECERQFVEFNSLVPYKYNPRYVNSFRLLMLLQTTCTQIEQLLKLLSKAMLQDESDANFPVLFKRLNEKKMLAVQEVVLYDTKEILKPFNMMTSKNIPEWWHGNNQTKHHLINGLYMGTIGETLNALAALLVLNRIAEVIPKAGYWNVFDSDQWLRIDSDPDKLTEMIPYFAEYYGKRTSQIFFHPFIVSTSKNLKHLFD